MRRNLTRALFFLSQAEAGFPSVAALLGDVGLFSEVLNCLRSLDLWKIGRDDPSGVGPLTIYFQ